MAHVVARGMGCFSERGAGAPWTTWVRRDSVQPSQRRPKQAWLVSRERPLVSHRHTQAACDSSNQASKSKRDLPIVQKCCPGTNVDRPSSSLAESERPGPARSPCSRKTEEPTPWKR
ncbi:hypothetical protein CDD81_7733 [Ophiocordyceps australis]|uniref:Uncharacterized protein n=1 Tax=Ophiocordyceps australis TaxID=1399860 RepID=A0A2C5XGN0_9HYPO|nr:hypothetical protein CDD81_7733 [Ophiocordyceps australis]